MSSETQRVSDIVVVLALALIGYKNAMGYFWTTVRFVPCDVTRYRVITVCAF